MNISGTREDVKERKTPLNEFRKKADDLSNSLLASELKVCGKEWEGFNGMRRKQNSYYNCNHVTGHIMPDNLL